jgi:hypothetical protein
VLGKLVEHRVRPRAHAHGGDVAREHQRRVAQRDSCNSSERSTTAWPASSSMPTSKDSLVRVEGFWKISATLRPSSARERSGSAFSSSARSSSASNSAADSSAPVRNDRDMDEPV